MVDAVPFTPAHCRAARGLLRWSQIDLARAARAAVVTVRRFETGVAIGAKPVDALRRVLVEAGVVLLPPGSQQGVAFDVAVALRTGVALAETPAGDRA